MKTNQTKPIDALVFSIRCWVLNVFLFSSGSALAAVHYVDVNSTNATPPYTNWASAATNIQDAVDAAVAGDEIVVTNGIYATGGRAVYGTMTNRVAVDKPLTLRSVNGPQFTVIQGHQVPFNGNGAIRCVYLTNGASLSGFTLTNGATRFVYDYPANRESSGGGLWCESTNAVAVSNCVVTGNSAYSYGGGAYGGTLNNCTLTRNGAGYYGGGGGAYVCTLNNCTLTGNGAAEGGGAYSCTLNNCILSGNSASGNYYSSGGGAYSSTLNNCALIDNLAYAYVSIFGGGSSQGSSYACGGGASYCTLNNCTLTHNSAQSETDFHFYVSASGGGAYSSTLNNCTLSGNSANATNLNSNFDGGDAEASGGGAHCSTLNNCTLSGNSASAAVNDFNFHQAFAHGGGADYATLNNCIVHFNATSIRYRPIFGDDYSRDTLNHCWTSDPLFVDTNGWANLRLQSNSPCINAGRNAFAPAGPDLDGNPRIAGGTVDIGVYEFQTPVSRISYAWLQQYGLPINANTDAADPDGDGMNNWQEWRSGTDPTNALSALRVLAPMTDNTNVTVTWQSVAGVSYFLERSASLAAPPAFTPLVTNLPGQPGTTSYTDTNAVGSGPFFYRVGVSAP